MQRTILIGGKHHGEPIDLTGPVLPTLTIIGEPNSHAYTLAYFEFAAGDSEIPETRAFYISDDIERAHAKQLAFENWLGGALLR